MCVEVRSINRRNGFLKFLADAKPDVLCCQEIKGECPLNVPGYLLFWNPAKRSNYSGTLVLSRSSGVFFWFSG